MNEKTHTKTIPSQSAEGGRQSEDFWFPGRWVGGIAMILGPILLLVGALLRIQFHYFFPQQLAAFAEHPTLMVTAYSAFLAGNILLWPAIVTLARLIGAKRPGWAVWGGAFVIFGLFARAFHAGIDHLAFQMVRVQGLELATKTAAGSYGAFHIVSILTPLILFGWIALAIGAYLSRTLGLFRSIALGLMSALMIGVLKGSSLVSVVAIGGLCVALVPLGVKVLREGPKPSYRTILGWSVLMIGLVIILFFLGQAG
ncbi:MAG TPA: hypothetical protein VE715_13290 [Blastocatellia bacterium]|nr:hypothetical protein [Blastocatellia bacterium]